MLCDVTGLYCSVMDPDRVLLDSIGDEELKVGLAELRLDFTKLKDSN